MNESISAGHAATTTVSTNHQSLTTGTVVSLTSSTTDSVPAPVAVPLEAEQGDDYTYPNAATCPDCGAAMLRYGRCVTCPSCGLEGCGW